MLRKDITHIGSQQHISVSIKIVIFRAFAVLDKLDWSGPAEVDFK